MPADALKQIRPERRPAFGTSRRVGPRGAETHLRILEAGLRELDEAGYHGTRVEAIAARAGCSRPTFYQYFADKPDFFFRLATHVNGELDVLTRAFPGLDRGRSSRDALREWLARVEGVRARYAPVFRFEALLRSDPRIARGSEDRVLATGAAIAGAVEAPLPTRVPPALHGALLFSTITEAFGAAGDAVPRERRIEGAADWLHRCFLGAIPGVNTGLLPLRRARARRTRAAPRPPAPPPPALGRKAARSRARLVEAAREVLGRLGFEGTRIDDIASAAAMSHGTFYRYFASKEELFREVATPAVEDVLALLEALPAPHGGLYAWSRRLYQTDSVHCGLFSAWAESEQARAVMARGLTHELAAAVEAALAERPFGDATVDGLLLVAHLERAPYSARVYPRIPQPDAVTATGEILERGFFGAPAPSP